MGASGVVAHLVSSIRCGLGQSAPVGYSALETAVVMLAVRVAGGRICDDTDGEDWTRWDGWRVMRRW
jgi:hypothetical protein